MRTSSKHASRHITVMAESVKSFGKIITHQPSIKLRPAMCSNFFPMLVAASIEMVNAKKFSMQFSAARTLFPIMGKYLSLNSLLTLAVIRKYFFPILIVKSFFHAKKILSIFIAPFTHSTQTFLPMFPIVFAICDSLSFCIHNNILYHETPWDGKTILR